MTKDDFTRIINLSAALIEAQQAEIEHLQYDLAGYKTAGDEMEAEIDRLTQDNLELTSKFEGFADEHERLTAALNARAKIIDDLQKRRNKLQAERDEWRDKWIVTRDFYDALDEQNDELRDELDKRAIVINGQNGQLKTAWERMDFWKQSAGKAHDQFNELADVLELRDERIARLVDKVKHASKERNDRLASFRSLKDANDILHRLNDQKAEAMLKLEERVAELELYIKELESIVAKLEKANAPLAANGDRAREYAYHHIDTIAALEAEIARLESDSKAAGANVAAMAKHIDRIDKSRHSLADTIDSLEAEIDKLKKENKRLSGIADISQRDLWRYKDDELPY